MKVITSLRNKDGMTIITRRNKKGVKRKYRIIVNKKKGFDPRLIRFKARQG